MKNKSGKLQLILGILVICLTAYILYLNSYLDWTASNIRHFGMVTIVFITFIVAIILVINQRQKNVKKYLNTEFKWLLMQLEKQRRSTRKIRHSFLYEGKLFIKELNSFILPDTYELELEALLEAEKELEDQKKSYYQKNSTHLRRSRKKDNSPTLDIENIERDLTLTELALVELNNKSLLIPKEGRYSKDNKKEFRKLIQRKQQVYEENHRSCGQYFRGIELILRLLNNALANDEISMKEYKSAIETLRGQFSHDDLLLVLIYALIIPEGCSLGVELTGSSFFGNSTEINHQSFIKVPEILLDLVIGEFTSNGNKRQFLKQQVIMKNQLVLQVKAKTDFSKTKRAKVYQILTENVEGFVNLDRVSFFNLVDYFDIYS